MIRSEAEITPEVLAWARVSLGLKQEDAAKRLKVPTDRIDGWERGVGRPSIPQAEKLAGLYKRPLAVMYMPAPPREPAPPSDFRTLPGNHEAELSPTSRLAIRKAQRLQRIAAELAHDLGIARSVKLPRVSLAGDPENTASRVREDLGVPIETQMGWADKRYALTQWRRAVEKTGILVFQLDFPVDEMRGFSLPSPTTPAIALSVHDGPAPRSFSMFHEFAHLAARAAVLCDMGWKSSGPAPTPIIKTEMFCNHFAGALLVPRDALLSQITAAGAGSARDSDWPDERLHELARAFKVSREVILRRLLILGLTTQAYYERKRRDWAAEKPSKPQKKGFKVSPARTSFGERGAPLVSMLVESYSQGNITFSDLTEYLGVRGRQVKKVVELAARIA
jgi:Zn-dependent peptidase ImmA (M78 family)/transcriptional regulator with XRE-family HTH domain